MKQFVPSDFCLKCQGCCRFRQKKSPWAPQLLRTERERLSRKIKLVADKRCGSSFRCFSLGPHDNKCRVYSRRPWECRLYPFLIHLRAKQVFLAVDLNCPFVQEHLEQPGFKKYRKYLGNFLQNPAQQKILSYNPQLIQAYKGVRDLLILNI